ncbi:hypothetical protein B0O80DRAFT_488489 [Mortierella sp. GBAus27b]|nr:hypothetical protein B0O80DRAFT_488489 [Mortierella sp. GBAus27b]
MTMAPGTSEKDHPLLLPGVLIVLRSFLSKEDLLQTTQVCKSWHSVFIPKLWHTVRVGAKHKGRGHIHKSDHLDTLEHHLPFVRSLDIAVNDPFTGRIVKDSEAEKAEERLMKILPQCRGLTHLKTNAVNDKLINMLSCNRETMVSLKLNSAVKGQYTLHCLWYVVSGDSDTLCLGNLRHLTLKGVMIHGDLGDPDLHLAFVKLCQRLESLECRGCPMNLWPMPPSFMADRNDETQLTPWTLKQVKLEDVVDSILIHAYFLDRCTLLEELTLSSRRNHPLDTWFLPFLVRSRLKFFAMDGILLPDKSLAKLMESLPSTVTTLRLNSRSKRVKMGPLFVTAAAAATSPSLSIRSFQPDASKLTSTLTQQLLSTCANIDCFDDGLFMNAVDLLTAPWVMSRLVKLRLTIKDVACLRTATYSTHDGGLDRVIYEQLSRLVSLEDLSLGDGWNPGSPAVNRTSWIEFSLHHGMGELATLERLRRLDIRRLRGLRMSADEGPWIRDHWPALEDLLVRSFHQDFLSDMNLTTYLHENRPRLRITKG